MKVSTTAKSSDQVAGTCAPHGTMPTTHRRLPERIEREPSAEHVPVAVARVARLAEVLHRHGEALVGHEEGEQRAPAPVRCARCGDDRGAVHHEAQAHHGAGDDRHERRRPRGDQLADDELRDAGERQHRERDALERRQPGGDRRPRRRRSRRGSRRGAPGRSRARRRANSSRGERDGHRSGKSTILSSARLLNFAHEEDRACCATARARGTRKTASPAGRTWTSPRRGVEEARAAGRLLAGRGLRLRLRASPRC